MAYIIDDALLEEIKHRSDIVGLISEYVDLKKSGSNYKGLCPFHNEKTPSFTVSPNKEFFHCFGCGEGGDQISFIMKKENLSFRDAVIFLAEKYNIPIKESSTINKEEENKRDRNYDANKKAAIFFYRNLLKSKKTMSYLENRKIDDETIKKFLIGYAPNSWDSLLTHLNALGFSKEELEEYNLVSKSKKGNYIDRFRNRVIFPIIDNKKRVIAFGGRVMDNSSPKYLNSSDTLVFNKGHNLYNLNLLSSESSREKIILVEGYMDVISLYKSGINYAVASLGTALTKEQALLLKRYGREVYICYDGDEAGIRATNRAIDILIENDIEPKIIALPGGVDPDDYVKKYGKLSFELEISKSITYLEFKINNIKKNYNLESPEGLSKFTIEVSKIISRIKNPIERDIYIDKISKDYKVSKNSISLYIKNLYNTKRIGYNKLSNRRKINIIKKDTNIVEGRKKAEEQLLRYCIDSDESFNIIRNYIKPYDFYHVNCRLLFEEILKKENSQEAIDTLLNNKIISKEFMEKIKSIKVDRFNSDKVIKDLILKVKQDNNKENKNRILKEIKEIESKEMNNENLEILKKLIKELDEINKSSIS